MKNKQLIYVILVMILLYSPFITVLINNNVRAKETNEQEEEQEYDEKQLSIIRKEMQLLGSNSPNAEIGLPTIEQPTTKQSTDKKPKPKPTKKKEPKQYAYYLENIPLSKELQQYTFNQCNKDETLYLTVMAIMQTESNFDVNSVGADGHDLGIMQIRDCNLEYLESNLGSQINLMDPYDNIKSGVFMVKSLYEDYEYLNLVLMAYNCGRSGANNLWKQGIYSTEYSNKVTENYNILKGNKNNKGVK